MPEKTFTVFASRYSTLEELEQKRQHDYALEIRSMTDYVEIKATSLNEAFSKFGLSPVLDQLPYCSEWHLFCSAEA